MREKKLASNPYARLRRAYCRKYGLNPLTVSIPKSELIADAAYDEFAAETAESVFPEGKSAPSPERFFQELKEHALRRKPD